MVELHTRTEEQMHRRVSRDPTKQEWVIGCGSCLGILVVALLGFGVVIFIARSAWELAGG